MGGPRHNHYIADVVRAGPAGVVVGDNLDRVEVVVMWTVLIAGLCASILEHKALPPMVMVGSILGDQCLWQFTISDHGEIDRRYVIGVNGEHSLRAEIGETYAKVFVDGKEFYVPRDGGL